MAIISDIYLTETKVLMNKRKQNVKFEVLLYEKPYFSPFLANNCKFLFHNTISIFNSELKFSTISLLQLPICLIIRFLNSNEVILSKL